MNLTIIDLIVLAVAVVLCNLIGWAVGNWLGTWR
jgi:hypothetical protein